MKRSATTRYATVTQTARYLGYPVTTVGDWVRRGRLSTIRQGNVWLVSVADVRRLRRTVDEMDGRDTLGNRVRLRRLDLGWTQARLGYTMQPFAPSGVISKIERGVRRVESDMLNRLAVALDVSPDWLLFGCERKEQTG